MRGSLLILFVALNFAVVSCIQTAKESTDRIFVYDFENILSEDQEHTLDSIIRDYEKKTTNEIAIITVADIANSPKMAHYATEIGDSLGIGKPDKNNGLIIMMSSNMRETFIATGYGVEDILKDEICKVIVDSFMIPYFKNQEYFEGIKSGLDECMNRWN
jgi:uncharacterized protein